MARDKETVCAYYICMGQCKKGRDASHFQYCQKCNLYKPRVKVQHINRKKEKLEKIRDREWKDE